jgi:hypothetical protein
MEGVMESGSVGLVLLTGIAIIVVVAVILGFSGPL